MSRLCHWGFHHKANRRRWFGPCRRCGLPLFGRNIPITSEATLRVYRQRLEDYDLADRLRGSGVGQTGPTGRRR